MQLAWPYALGAAFPNFHAEFNWQTAEGEIVTTYKTYHGTHKGTFLGIVAHWSKDPFRDRRCHASA